MQQRLWAEATNSRTLSKRASSYVDDVDDEKGASGYVDDLDHDDYILTRLHGHLYDYT